MAKLLKNARLEVNIKKWNSEMKKSEIYWRLWCWWLVLTWAVVAWSQTMMAKLKRESDKKSKSKKKWKLLKFIVLPDYDDQVKNKGKK